MTQKTDSARVLQTQSINMAEAPPSYEAPADAKGKDGGGAAAGAAAAAAPPMYTKGAITYTYVSACQACVYLVRSDGIVRRILELLYVIYVYIHPSATHSTLCSL